MKTGLFACLHRGIGAKRREAGDNSVADELFFLWVGGGGRHQEQGKCKGQFPIPSVSTGKIHSSSLT